MEAMRDRAPDAIRDLAAAIGTQPARIGERITQLGPGPRTLGELGADRGRLEDVVDQAMARPQLGWTPSPPDRADLTALLESAW
jgi:alcohol dehydrogenase class IV